jgi:hypothetical protein
MSYKKAFILRDSPSIYLNEQTPSEEKKTGKKSLKATKLDKMKQGMWYFGLLIKQLDKKNNMSFRWVLLHSSMKSRKSIQFIPTKNSIACDMATIGIFDNKKQPLCYISTRSDGSYNVLKYVKNKEIYAILIPEDETDETDLYADGFKLVSDNGRKMRKFLLNDPKCVKQIQDCIDNHKCPQSMFKSPSGCFV